MRSKLYKCKMILSMILFINVVAFVILGINRFMANLCPNEEVWVNEINRSEVQAYAASLGFPQEDIVRVVYIPGLGDGNAVIYYKDTTLSSFGMKNYDRIFTEYGEIEGTRTTHHIFIALLIILVIDLIGKKIINELINDISESQ